MPAQNLFEEIKQALTDFKAFLGDKKDEIKLAVAPLDEMTGGKVSELITTLIDLLNKLKAEIEKLDPAAIPGLPDVTTFSNSVKTLVEASRTLLTEQQGAIDQVLGVVEIVGGVGALTGEIKQQVLQLIQEIIGDLQFIKS